MAEYVKFRLATAKVGVSMALLALIAGVAEKARAASTPTAKPAASGGLFLKITGLAPTIASDFNKIEKKLIKFDSAISSLDKKVVKLSSTLSKNYYSAQKADKTFLKITDANIKFLPAGGTAANAQKLGGLAPNQFFQGSGNVVSGVLGNLTQQPQTVLSLPGGIIVVKLQTQPAGPPQLTVFNATGQALRAVLDVNGTAEGVTLSTDPLGNSYPIVLNNSQSADIRIQTFPGGTFTNVVSILIGLTPNPSTNQPEAVAQAFTGGV